jgi:hypothetical protein
MEISHSESLLTHETSHVTWKLSHYLFLQLRTRRAKSFVSLFLKTESAPLKYGVKHKQFILLEGRKMIS